MKLTLTHIYPKNLNLYGDSGNLKILQKRCELRGIQITIQNLESGKSIPREPTDIFFMGGGQDQNQIDIVDDFYLYKKNYMVDALEEDVIFLGVCGGYQLMGKEFLTGDKTSIKGLNILDITTKAPSTEVKTRCIGNLVAKIGKKEYTDMSQMYTKNVKIPQTLVGFENHSGQTFLGENTTPLAKTLHGFGNNSSAEFEGARYKNTFGSYMHGPLLSKNPHFADYLVYLAVQRRYKDDIKLDPLDDSLEYKAHLNILSRS